MSRTDQRRRRVLRAFAPVAGLLAVGLLVWQGSYAAFSATTPNTNDAWTSGQMTLVNDAGTGTYAASTPALFTETNLKPGTTVTKCLTVKAGGTLGGTLKLYRGAIAPGGTGAAIAPQLTLVVVASAASATPFAPLVQTNCTGFPAGGTTISTAVVPATSLANLPSTYATGLGATAVPAGTQYVAYKIQYTFTSTGSDTTDNTMQNSSATADLNWEMQ